MSESQLEALVRAHRFVPNKLRTNVSSDLRWSGRKPFLRTAILSNTLSSGPIVDLCRQELGADINGVDEEGRTTDAEIIYSIPFRLFGEAALEAVAEWEYEPMIIIGEPRRRDGVVTQFVFEFRQ